MAVPMVPICATTVRRVPSPMASMTMTDATPITIPSKVRLVRTRLTFIPRQALRAASASSDNHGAALSCDGNGKALSAARGVLAAA